MRLRLVGSLRRRVLASIVALLIFAFGAVNVWAETRARGTSKRTALPAMAKMARVTGRRSMSFPESSRLI